MALRAQALVLVLVLVLALALAARLLPHCRSQPTESGQPTESELLPAYV